jgi:arylsulfatase A-like enzyme
LLDDDLLEFLKYLKTSGIMENTILLLMSDHGVRVSELRQYSQGKLEEVSKSTFPFLFFIIHKFLIVGSFWYRIENAVF